MINIQSNSNKLIIVVHEIYGVNQHMKKVCHSLSERGFDVICPNLLEIEGPFEYSFEEVAYRNFMENIGFINATNKIKRVLQDNKDSYEKVFIVGFSVGATIAWLCSEENDIDGIVGYYGSRIRNYLEIEPLCSTMLFFPESEKSFNVNELISYLEKKNIEIHKIHGEHGFSDPNNSKYNVKSAQESFDILVDFLSKH
ncbi:dienelactone hydrolase family protein [Psychrobacillus sp. FSL H8-0483]|uniref:dienelactone hydrolase family protein n=1 Tax=Psychrobacillus sp. FSL H8-0483 TaxID=2921389 RepID=UPI00315AFC57